MDEHEFAEPEWVATDPSGDGGAEGLTLETPRTVVWDDPADSDDELAEALVQVGCLESSVRLELVRLVARLDRRRVWQAEGQTTMANWVTLQCGVSVRTARQIAEVARVIDQLPTLAAAFGEGRLSWDQLVPLCRLATAASDEAWAVDGAGYSAEDLNKMVRAKQIRDDHARDAHERRSLTFRPDGPGSTAIRGRLPTDQAEAVATALDRIREQEAVKDHDTGKKPTRAQQRADALASLARRGLGADTDIDRATVVLHADADLVTGENPDGHASTADGTPLAAETVRRHCCDTRIEWGLHGPDGIQLGIRRASRVWSPWLNRLIRHRDGDRCRFPGCERPIHQIHHIAHWIPTAGTGPPGETNADNGVGLCYFHHHEVHEGGWKVFGNADVEVVFTSPRGTRLASRPRRLDPELKRRLQGVAPHLWDNET